MNATELLADVKLKGQFEASQATISDANILDLATKELQTVIVPKILSVRENFFATSKDFTITSLRKYRIPKNAVGGKVIGVEYVNGSVRRVIKMVDAFDNTNAEGFYVNAGSIILTTNAPTSGTLRIHYCARPGVLTTTYKEVQGVEISGQKVNSGAHGYSTGNIVSIQKSSSPFEFVVQNAVITVVDVDNFTLNATLYPDISDIGMEIGDIITLEAASISTVGWQSAQSTCYYPQIPVELHDWLSYRSTIRCLEHIGHMDQAASKMQKLVDIEKDILALLSPRVDVSGKVIIGGELLGSEDFNAS